MEVAPVGPLSQTASTWMAAWLTLRSLAWQNLSYEKPISSPYRPTCRGRAYIRKLPSPERLGRVGPALGLARLIGRHHVLMRL